MLASCFQRSCCLKSVEGTNWVSLNPALSLSSIDISDYLCSLSIHFLISRPAAKFLPCWRLRLLILSLTTWLLVTRTASFPEPWPAMVCTPVRSCANSATESLTFQHLRQISERSTLARHFAGASGLTLLTRDVPVRTRICSSCLWEVCCCLVACR